MPVAEIIYFDTCAVNRLMDDLSQPRVHREAEAVAAILELVARKEIRWVASSVVRLEIAHNPHLLRRTAALEVLSTADEFVEPTADTLKLALTLARQGLSGIDAVHVATAQQVGADALITTDDRLLRRAANTLPGITVSVVNPVDWWQRRQQWLLSHP